MEKALPCVRRQARRHRDKNRDMKRSKQQLIWKLAAVLLAGSGLVSCSQDDATDLSSGTLPEGEYPLVLTASVDGMVTRSEGKDAWTGDGTEYIGVRMGTGGTAAQYVVDSNKESLSPASDDQTIYWQNTDPATISAWYPYETETATVDITDQSNGFAGFDYLSATAENITFGNTVELKFRHQMAKVSYTLIAGDGITETELADATVLFAGYTTATFSEGALTGTTNGWITPTAEDVLLVPQDMSSVQFIKLSINGSTYAFTPTDADLQAGCHYIYNITVNAEGLKVETSDSSIGWGEGSSGSGTVYMSSN